MNLSFNPGALLPAGMTALSALVYIGLFCLAVLFVSFIFKLILGKNSALNQAVSTALGILCIYAVSAVVYTFNPYGLTRFLAPLPFVRFSGDRLILFSFTGSEFPAICHQVLSMIILTFLVNLIDDRFPNGKGVVGWAFYRILSVVGAMAVHYLTHVLLITFIPGFLEGYAPMILVSILLFMFALGFLKFLIGLVLTVANPVLGALYGFFFGNKTGKQISKAVFATSILTAFVLFLERIGFHSVPISVDALGSYVPVALIVMLVWFVIGRLL